MALFLAVLLTVLPCSASWVSDIIGLDVNIPAGTINFGPPRPDRIPLMLQNLPQDAANFFLNPAGNALAVAIRQAKANVLRIGCGPASPQVIDALSPFMPSSVFSGVCWATLRPGFTLDTFAIQDGGAAAITLEDVIVFKDSASGFDPVLWAHELTHVLQYRRLGVEGFANLYTVAWNSLESEAYSFQNFVASRIGMQPSAPTWQRQYYSTTPNWNPMDGITQQQYVEQARLTINPQTCTHLERGVTNSVQVWNRCPIPIRVVTFQYQNMQNRSTFTNSCISAACTVMPGLYSAWPEFPGVITIGATMVW